MIENVSVAISLALAQTAIAALTASGQTMRGGTGNRDFMRQ